MPGARPLVGPARSPGGHRPPTLASLVHHSALKLTVRAGEERLATPVRWAHASELADPVPYM
ncbi:PucR family transcriptional regulator, partial [Streptomyces albidoflavus]